MASKRHAPEGTYDPYFDDEESDRFGEYGSYGYEGPHHRPGHFDFFEQSGPHGRFDAPGPHGQYDSYASQQADTYGAYDSHSTYDSHGTYGYGTYGYGTDGAYATQEFAAQEFAAPESGSYEFGSYDFGPGKMPPVPDAFDSPPSAAPGEEWNPTEESVRPVRGRHKFARQRGGSMARSSAVLGVGMIAAVGAGGIATAQEKPSAAISMPDVAEKAKELPGVKLLAGGDENVTGQPLTQAALTASDTEEGRTDTGEALRSRILQQAQSQQSQAEASARDAAIEKAADAAQAKAAKAKDKAEAAERRKAEEARLAKLAKSFKLPVSGYQLTSQFGESGSLWSNGHTGTDFAAASGTPIRAIHSGTIKEAGWAGSFGYRTILQLDDGTELWFCHQSSMNVSVGQKVRTGETIGRVGSTGNVTGAHLHLEVHPGGGDAIDPAAWLRGKGLTP